MTSADASSLQSARQPYSQSTKKFIGYLSPSSQNSDQLQNRNLPPFGELVLNDPPIVSNIRFCSVPLRQQMQEMLSPATKLHSSKSFHRKVSPTASDPYYHLENNLIASEIRSTLFTMATIKPFDLQPSSATTYASGIVAKNPRLEDSSQNLQKSADIDRTPTQIQERNCLDSLQNLAQKQGSLMKRARGPGLWVPRPSFIKLESKMIETPPKYLESRDSRKLLRHKRVAAEGNIMQRTCKPIESMALGKGLIGHPVEAIKSSFLDLSEQKSQLAAATQTLNIHCSGSQRSSQQFQTTARHCRKYSVVQYNPKQVPSSECHPNSTLEDVSRPSVSEQPQLSLRSRQASIAQQSPSQTLKDLLACELDNKRLTISMEDFRARICPRFRNTVGSSSRESPILDIESKQTSAYSVKSILVKRDQSSRDISRLNDSCSPKKKVAFAKNKMVLLFTKDA